MKKITGFAFLVCSLLFLSFITSVLTVSAVEETSPVKALVDRDVYYPVTQDLTSDEMRVTACGRGQPEVRILSGANNYSKYFMIS